MRVPTPPSRLLAFSFVFSLASTAWAAPDGGSAPPPGSCTAGECHQDVEVDAKHRDKGIGCTKCHPSVTRPEEKHAGAIDAFPPEKICAQAGCHAEATEKQLGGLHKDSTCDSCHGTVHDGLTRADYSACKGCHGDQAGALGDSVHGKAKKPVACPDCHGDIHAVKPKTDPLAPISKVLQVSTCSECHDDNYVRAFRTSVHGKGLLLSGLAVAPACSDCHGAHDIQMTKSASSKVFRHNVVTTCGKCHAFILARWKASTHGQLWLKEEAAKTNGAPPTAAAPRAADDGRPRVGPVCTDCHPGHLTFDPMVYGNHLKMADRCGECHRRQSASYRESFHGQATRLDLSVAATCANCHTPHEMLPEADPRSSVHPKNLGKTCGTCHQPVNAGFLGFDTHMDPHDPTRSRAVHWVWLFMTALLVGVFGFFALHTLLWLQRSIVALARHEHRRPVPGGKWVRRFWPLHIWIHLVVVTTFLLLAATGLPLRFSGVAWARPIAALFGGLPVTRWVHRIAGLATFAYAAAYVAYLGREILSRRRFELLWGWKSMVPNGKDVVDFLHNLRWFLYLGPPPKLDRWAYWEKFDFFAVFWGVPVIGLSGLVLWTPLWFTRFLPGWVLNIAHLVHGDEALLATGFIFLFHFFHTHLRPEAFPLDPVIFLGRMPLERLREERPVEYQRLVDSGELDKLLTDPPSERAVWRATRFGAAALAVGVLLGIFLLSSSFRLLVR